MKEKNGCAFKFLKMYYYEKKIPILVRNRIRIRITIESGICIRI